MDWIIGLVSNVFSSLFTLLSDAFLWLLKGFFQFISSALSAIPVPSFLDSGLSVGSLFGSFPPFALFLIAQMDFGQCFSILAAGISFYLLRKVITLGQW